MPEEIIARRREVKLYIDHAYQMLEVAASNRKSGFYASAVNRAYYAIFYAAMLYCLLRVWLAANIVAY